MVRKLHPQSHLTPQSAPDTDDLTDGQRLQMGEAKRLWEQVYSLEFSALLQDPEFRRELFLRLLTLDVKWGDILCEIHQTLNTRASTLSARGQGVEAAQLMAVVRKVVDAMEIAKFREL